MIHHGFLALAFVGTPLLLAEDRRVIVVVEKKEELTLTKEEQEIIDLTNAERKNAGLEPLKPNRQLMAAARGHAANMARQEKLEHTLDDKDFADRAKAAGYKFAMLGENIAWDNLTPRDAVERWMSSKQHKENILQEKFTEIGVAVAKSKKGELYWVQVFGAPLR